MVEEALDIAQRCRGAGDRYALAVSTLLAQNFINAAHRISCKAQQARGREPVVSPEGRDEQGQFVLDEVRHARSQAREYGAEMATKTCALRERVEWNMAEVRQSGMTYVLGDVRDAVNDESGLPESAVDRIQFFMVATLTVLCLGAAIRLGRLYDAENDLHQLKAHLFWLAGDVAEVAFSLRDRVEELQTVPGVVGDVLDAALSARCEYLEGFARSDYDPQPSGVLGVQWGELLSTTDGYG